VAVLKVPSKQVYCLVCKKFKILPLQDTECPRCHSKFRCAPVDYIAVKKKVSSLILSR
jgi:hypothetical protein